MNFFEINLYKFILIYFILNIFSFFIYYEDKNRAKKHLNRISEKNLIFISFFAPIGATFSMIFFKHKTRKIKFKLVYLFFIAHIFLAIKILEIFIEN